MKPKQICYRNQILGWPRLVKTKNTFFFWQKTVFNCCRLAAYKLAASFLDPSQLFFSKGWPWVEAINSSFPLGRRAGRAHSCMTPFPPSVPPPHPHPVPASSLVLAATHTHTTCPFAVHVHRFKLFSFTCLHPNRCILLAADYSLNCAHYKPVCT